LDGVDTNGDANLDLWTGTFSNFGNLEIEHYAYFMFIFEFIDPSITSSVSSFAINYFFNSGLVASATGGGGDLPSGGEPLYACSITNNWCIGSDPLSNMIE
jgi:hypothetical protein